MTATSAATNSATNSAPSSPRLPAASVHLNGQIPRQPLIELEPSFSKADLIPPELIDFVNRTSSPIKTEILSQTLAVLKLLETYSPDDRIGPIDTIVTSCKELELIEPEEVFTCTKTGTPIEHACKEFGKESVKNIAESIINFAGYICSRLLVELQNHSGEADSLKQTANIAKTTIALHNIIDKASSTNKKNTSNIIDNTPIDKGNFTQKKHLEDMCLLQRPFVAFGRAICEIWISLFESIKAIAKAVQTFITSYATAEGRRERKLEKLKHDLSRHVTKIFAFLKVISSSEVIELMDNVDYWAHRKNIYKTSSQWARSL